MNQLDEIKRGREAEQLMNNPMFKEAVESVKAGIIDAMEASGITDEKGHNKLVIALQTLEQIKKHIKTTMETGKMAQIQVERETLGKKLQRAAGFRTRQ
jgi:hypothetical protein